MKKTYNRRFNYHKRRIKKSDLETQLMNYQLLNTPLGQEFVMDYFNVNVILYDFENKVLRPYLSYNEERNNNLIGFRKTKPIILLPIINNDSDTFSLKNTEIAKKEHKLK